MELGTGIIYEVVFCIKHTDTSTPLLRTHDVDR